MSGGKMARHAASITNLPNGGGNKKGGLAPSIGNFISSNPNLIGATNTQFGVSAVGNFTSPAQSTYRRAVRGLF